MAEIKLKKGYKIRLKGAARKEIVDVQFPKKVAIKPTDFVGLKPKLEVSVGDSVQVGSVLFHSKENENIKFTSPASGKVSDIIRGARRVIEAVVVETDEKQDSIDFSISNSDKLKKEEIVQHLLNSGLFTRFIQRPFGTICDPKDTPRDIFISAMDTAPLAPDVNLILEGNEESFQKGLDILSKITTGKVRLGIDRINKDQSKALTEAKGVEINKFSGPHPAGNVGVHIHHIAPIKSREDVVWTMDVQGVILVGRLFETGKLSMEVIVAVAGGAAVGKRYYRTVLGASIEGQVRKRAINEEMNFDNVRFISGNVLTGKKIDNTGFVGTFDNMVTVIPEPTEHQFLGWVTPGFSKLSRSNTFFASIFRRNTLLGETASLNGGHRAFVVSGIYDSVLPMDILPIFLVKAMLAEEIDEMESLGAYEIIEEDLALCEYIDPCKNNIQDMVRTGLNFIEREG